jgi:uracil-DNA glycosylase
VDRMGMGDHDMGDLALLRLYVEWGADEALDCEPADRLRVVARAVPRVPPVEARLASSPGTPLGSPLGTPLGGASSLAPPASFLAAPLAAVPRATPAERAIAVAAEAATLEALRAAVATFDGCALRETASNLVFADGDPDAALLIVGEPPGADEDRGGRPFAGSDGALLDKMLGSIGLTRSQALLVPMIPWRPPGGRPPNPAEIAVCLPFLHRVVALASPRRIVIFGGLATRALIHGGIGRRRAIGWVDCAIPGVAAPVPILPLPGLATLGKTPLNRRDIWAGLRLLRRALDGDAAPGQIQG